MPVVGCKVIVGGVMGVSDSLITANKQLMHTKERECHEQILGKLGLPIFAKIFITSNITKKKKRNLFISPSSQNRGKVATLGTDGGSDLGGADSVYSMQLDSGSGHSSDTQKHYETLICGASPTLPSESSKPTTPHTPPLRSGSQISEPFKELGLRRACNADLTQSSSPCVNVPGGLALKEVAGVVIRGESRSEDLRDSRGGQEEGGDPGPNPLGGSGGPSEESGPSSPHPPNCRKEETRCCKKSVLAI